ncbi:hypothetical protein [Rhodococcus ruber]
MMWKQCVAGFAAFVVAGVVTGCSGDSEPVAIAETTTVATSTVPKPELSPRGAIIKTVGEPAGVMGGYGDGEKTVEFILTNVAPDPQCWNEWGSNTTPKNGRWVQLDFDVTTGAGVPVRALLGKYDFYAVSSDGYIGEVGATDGGECVESAAWEGVEEPKPNSKYQASIVLDVPADTAVIGYDWDETVSWEWELPAT